MTRRQLEVYWSCRRDGYAAIQSFDTALHRDPIRVVSRRVRRWRGRRLWL